MELFLLYLWLKLEALHWLLSILQIPVGIVSGGILLYTCVESPAKEDRTVFYGKVLGLVWIGLIFLKLIIPTQTQVAVLVGAKVAMDMATSPEGTKVATILRGKANEFLDSEISKLKQGAK